MIENLAKRRIAKLCLHELRSLGLGIVEIHRRTGLSIITLHRISGRDDDKGYLPSVETAGKVYDAFQQFVDRAVKARNRIDKKAAEE